MMKQQRELLRYRKTEKLRSSFTQPRAGSRVLCLDGGGVRGLIQIEVGLYIFFTTANVFLHQLTMCIHSV